MGTHQSFTSHFAPRTLILPWLVSGVALMGGMGIRFEGIGWTAEPTVAVAHGDNAHLELQRMIAARVSTAVLADWGEQLVKQGRAKELGSGLLPWTTWNAPGWRWEHSFPNGERLLIATDGIVMVALREGRQLEFSVRDLTHGQGNEHLRIGGRTLLAEGLPAQFVVASSAADLARKSPKLFPIYYYFAGPTQEIVSSHLLPYPPLQLPN